MSTFLEDFVTESRELLESAVRCLLDMEGGRADGESIHALFRAVHTLKGLSGFLPIPGFTIAVHAGEDLLDEVRSGRQALCSDKIDLYLDLIDQLSAWVGALEATGDLPSDAMARGQAHADRLRQWIGGGKGKAAAAPEIVASPRSAPPAIPWLAEVPESLRIKIFVEAQKRQTPVTVITYVPDDSGFFQGADPLETVRKIPDLCWLSVDSRIPQSLSPEYNPYMCSLCFRVLSLADAEEVRAAIPGLDSQLELREIPSRHLAIPSGTSGVPLTPEFSIEETTRLVEAGQWTTIASHSRRALNSSIAPHLVQGSALRWLEVVSRSEQPDSELAHELLSKVAGIDERPDGVVQLIPTPAKTGPDIALRNAATEILLTQVEMLQTPAPKHLEQGRLAAVCSVLERVFLRVGFDDWQLTLAEALADTLAQSSHEPIAEIVRAAVLRLTGHEPSQSRAPAASSSEEHRLDESTTPPPAGEENSPSASSSLRSIKVDQERIDQLMELVGELVVAKNSIGFLARRAESHYNAPGLAREIKERYAAINRISEDLQSAVMRVRMVPLANAFQRFPRIVRDLSRKVNKQVRLTVEGDEVEADKNVVESLSEPLVHLIRNSIDHGLEAPEKRVAAGKSPEGEIRLRAYQNEDRVFVEVADNGKGIDPAVIRRKGVEKGIIDQATADTMSDRDAIQLVFAAGFSTAETISDLSGRGVGMDVVRNMVLRTGGSLSLESELGKGTSVRLSLPLSMTVTQVIMIEVGKTTFGVPFDSIVEMVRIDAQSIHRVKDREACVLRDRLVPLCRLEDALALPAKANRPQEEAVLVVNVAGAEMGLVVDRFSECIDVLIRPLEGIMANVPSYTGTALLGDGRVLLILNVREIAQCQ